MDDIFSGIRGIDSEVLAEDKTDFWMVLTNWAFVTLSTCYAMSRLRRLAISARLTPPQT